MAEWMTDDVLIAACVATRLHQPCRRVVPSPAGVKIRKIPWWDTYAALVSVDQFRAKFRIWPSTICDLVNRLIGSAFTVDNTESWHLCVATTPAKYIAHTACLLIHGMCTLIACSSQNDGCHAVILVLPLRPYLCRNGNRNGHLNYYCTPLGESRNCHDEVHVHTLRALAHCSRNAQV